MVTNLTKKEIENEKCHKKYRQRFSFIIIFNKQIVIKKKFPCYIKQIEKKNEQKIFF